MDFHEHKSIHKRSQAKVHLMVWWDAPVAAKFQAKVLQPCAYHVHNANQFKRARVTTRPCANKLPLHSWLLAERTKHAAQKPCQKVNWLRRRISRCGSHGEDQGSTVCFCEIMTALVRHVFHINELLAIWLPQKCLWQREKQSLKYTEISLSGSTSHDIDLQHVSLTFIIQAMNLLFQCHQSRDMCSQHVCAICLRSCISQSMRITPALSDMFVVQAPLHSMHAANFQVASTSKSKQSFFACLNFLVA